MKKIAIFQKNLNIGGIQRSLINLLNSISCKNYKIDLYLFDKKKFYTESIPDSINVVYLKPKNKIVRFLPFRFLNIFYRSQVHCKYDVAIDYDGYSNDTALALTHCDANKKVMWIHQDLKCRKKHDLKFRLLYTVNKKKYKYVDKFIAVSSGAKESFLELLNENAKCDVIPNIILSNQIIERSKEITDFTVDKNYINLVTVGRLIYQKGFDILINYMRDIIDQKKNIKLYIIGSGPDEKKLRNQIHKLELENNVLLLGSQTNPFNIMKKMDLFVLTSRFEGQGMVILEAKVLGLPICITKNIEKYNEGIKGSTNFVSDVLNFKKIKVKSYDSLTKYNNSIITSIYNLFDN